MESITETAGGQLLYQGEFKMTVTHSIILGGI